MCRVPHASAAGFIADHHYAGSCANTSVYSFGLTKDRLCGAALWMPPPAGAAKWWAKQLGIATWDLICLSRLAIHDSEPANAASLFLGAMAKDIAKEDRFCALVTYADTWRGHAGTIYKAAGWAYAGETEPTVCYVGADGRLVSHITDKGRSVGSDGQSRRVTTTTNRAAMEATGAKFLGKFSKHRFVKVLGG